MDHRPHRPAYRPMGTIASHARPFKGEADRIGAAFTFLKRSARTVAASDRHGDEHYYYRPAPSWERG